MRTHGQICGTRRREAHTWTAPIASQTEDDLGYWHPTVTPGHEYTLSAWCKSGVSSILGQHSRQVLLEPVPLLEDGPVLPGEPRLDHGHMDYAAGSQLASTD